MALSCRLSDLPPFPTWRARSHGEYQVLWPDVWPLHKSLTDRAQQAVEGRSLRGFSVPAGQFVDFAVSYREGGEINWRETVVCPVTGLNNRQRAAFHLFALEYGNRQDARIFVTEQITPFYRFLHGLFPNVIGAEYLPGLAPGAEDERGIRHEDLTQLSFGDAEFDAILTFDVLEHVPDYRSALRECVRVLKPGGRLYLTVPFTYGPETIVRARLSPDGGIEHLLEPEYHGDPMASGGVLAYYNFGFPLLDEMRAAGFSDAFVGLFNSVEFGYPGVMQSIFVCVK